MYCIFVIYRYTYKNDSELIIHKYQVVPNKIEIPDFIPFEKEKRSNHTCLNKGVF